MSRIIPLKQVMEMQPGEVVPGFRAQVKEVREPKSGNNQWGDWTMQSLTLMDGTAICPVKLFDCPVYDASWVGAWIIVESTADTTGKLRGIEWKEYKGKKELNISGKSATIEQATDLAPVAPAAPPAFHQPPAPATVPAAVRPAPVKPLAAAAGQAALPIKQPEPQKDGVAEAKKKLGQMANAMILSYDCALFIADQVQARNANIVIPLFSPDILEKIAVSMCIELTRSGLIMALPTGPLPAKKPALPPSQMAEPPENYGQPE